MRRRTVRTTMAALMLLGLAACGRGRHGDDSMGSLTGQGDRAVASSSDQDARAAASEKLNGYIKGYNTLIGTFGLDQQYQLYANQHLSEPVAPNRFINVSVGWLDNALDEFKTAHALPHDGLGDLDAVGDRMLSDLGRLVSELKELTIYYQSRGYLTDNWAKGRHEDAQVIADFKATMADRDALNTVLERAIAKRDQAELDALKRDGDLVGYDGQLAMQKSKALLALFNTPDDMRNPALFQKGDALVAGIESALADERKQLANVKKSDEMEHGLRNSGLTTAADRLETFVGHYRDLKQTGQPFNYQMMVAAYNDAVSNTNIMQ